MRSRSTRCDTVNPTRKADPPTGDTAPRSRTGTGWRGGVWWPWPLITLVLVLFIACHSNDHRVSLDELTEMEQGLAQKPPVPVKQHEELALTELHPYQVAPGDVLLVKTFGLSSLEQYAPMTFEQRVHPDGNIVMPVVGEIKVGGLTLNQVEMAIIAAHVPKVVRDLSVYVQLLEPETTTVLVLGNVTNPGFVKLRRNERNVMYALAAANGFGTTATEGGFSNPTSGRVRLKPIRGEREEIIYDMNDVNDVRRALLAPPLDSGDVLSVEAADASVVFICGPVQRPGPIPIPYSSTLSVLRAVATAGGLRDYLGAKEATLVRELNNGEQVHVKINLGDMLAGRTPDMTLRAGDILDIPFNADMFFQEWFLRNMIPGPFNISVRYDPLAQYNANRALQQTNGSVLNGIRSSLGSTIPSSFIPPPPTP